MATAKKSSAKRKDVTQSPTGEKAEDNIDKTHQPTPQTGTDKTSKEQLVREAAYRRWEARGKTHGQHDDDWLDAEKEVRPPEGN